MTSVDELSGATAERKPGDFKRNAHTGAPYVSDPTGATVKSGARKGEVKWVMYGRPSGFSHQIENTTNLEKWTQRQIVLGLCLKFNMLADAIRYLSDPAHDEDKWRDMADGIVKDALEAAKANLDADRGTHAHQLTEDDDTGADWLTRAEAGEDLGIGAEVQAALVSAWRQMLDGYGLEVLAAEVTVVNDTYRQAGTLDRIVRLTRDLTFTFDGEVFTIPAGTVLVLDLKTGRLRIAEGYWNGYAIQVAVYASSVPYDTATEKRGEWAWPIDQQWAIIAHLPVADALEGSATCRLYAVDLDRGHEAASIVMDAKAWEASRDAFGMAHNGPEIVVAVSAGSAPVATGEACDTSPADGVEASAPASPVGAIWKATMPDESELIDDPDTILAKLAEAYEGRPQNQRQIIDSLLQAAEAAHVPFGAMKTWPTVRRFEATRVAFAIAKHMWAETESTARAAIAQLWGDRPEVHQAPLGALIGSMTPDELRRLFLVIEDYSDGHFEEDWSSFPMRLKRAA